VKVQAKCGSEQRRLAVIQSLNLNGIDYVEIFTFTTIPTPTVPNPPANGLINIVRQLILLRCLKPISDALDEKNVIIKGGTRINDIRARWAKRADVIKSQIENGEDTQITNDLDDNEKNLIVTLNEPLTNVLVIRPNTMGDFSLYSLKLVQSVDAPDLVLDNFDLLLSEIPFSFKVDCPADFDCASEIECSSSVESEPVIDYMAKDFASFRRLLLDRLAVILPEWRDRSTADMGVMLIELLSYVGDHISYYQDSVSTEAYLGTARRRVSVQRHARLLNYFIHQGCNARAWTCLEIEKRGDGMTIPKKTKLLAGLASDPKNISGVGATMEQQVFEKALTSSGAIPFETMHDIMIYSAKNEAFLYNWMDMQCCLPHGGTTATLRNDKFLFVWENVPQSSSSIGNNDNDSLRLIDFLKQNYGVQWLDDEEPFRKTVDSVNNTETILASSINGRNSLAIVLNKTGEPSASLTINNEKKYEFVVKNENNTLSIYEVGNRFDLLLFRWDNIPRPSNDNHLDDSLRLIDFLKQNYGVHWLTDQEQPFKKSQDNTAILASSVDGTHTLVIILDDNKSRAFLVIDNQKRYEFVVKDRGDQGLEVNHLSLRVGDVILFEEIRSPVTGKTQDADLSHRHAVRLQEVTPRKDPLTNIELVEIIWGREDALPFPLFLWMVDANDKQQKPVTIIRANVVLVDHGLTILNPIGPELYREESTTNNGNLDEDNQIIAATEFLGNVPATRRFRPQLKNKPLTFRGPFDPYASASAAIYYDIRKVIPDILIMGQGKQWRPVRDLLRSEEFDYEFVVEMEDNGTAFIRFGNDETGEGRIPLKSTTQNPNPFFATYRVGNGIVGNVGPETITKIVLPQRSIRRVRNPIGAQGGTSPEPIDQVRLYAPYAFRTQQRAVTAEDYAEVLKRLPEVQKGAAKIRWTIGWPTVFVAIDRFGGKSVDDNFRRTVKDYLEKYRLTGYELEIQGPSYVPLEISLRVCIDPNYFQSEVRRMLVDSFSNRDLPDGSRGFFHPDNYTFGQPVYLSQIYAAAMKVDGVSCVTVDIFQRWGKSPNNELETGFVKIGPFEIARVDTDPNYLENGIITFEVEGGR
jgi:hypothetical protein